MSIRNSALAAILTATYAGVTTTSFAQVDPKLDSYLNLSPQYSSIQWGAAAKDRKSTGNEATVAGSSIPVNLAGGSAAASAACHSVVIDRDARWITVNQGETVKFVSNGKEFTWSFDGLASTYDLNSVLPPGALDHRVMVAVLPRSAAL